jgi:hypothetical protein
MGGIIALREVPYLIVYLIIAMSIAAIATLSAGRLTKWRYPQVTVVFGAFLIPVMIIGFIAYIIVVYPNGPPPNDAKAMAAAGLILLAVVTYPFTAVSSYLVGRQATR